MRDGACLAAASCAVTFPEQCRSHLPVLYPLWIRQLDDNVWSVRAHAAMALADVVRAYPQEALDVVLPHLRYCDLHLKHGAVRFAVGALLIACAVVLTNANCISSALWVLLTVLW